MGINHHFSWVSLPIFRKKEGFKHRGMKNIEFFKRIENNCRVSSFGVTPIVNFFQ